MFNNKNYAIMSYQVNVEFSYLPKINHIARDTRICMSLDECKEFIEITKKYFNENGIKRLRFTIWEIKKEVTEIHISQLYK